MPASFRHNRGRMMPADVVKPAQLSIASANDHNRFSDKTGSYKITRIFQLIGSRYQLPCLTEYVETLELGNTSVDIPRARNCQGVDRGARSS